MFNVEMKRDDFYFRDQWVLIQYMNKIKEVYHKTIMFYVDYPNWMYHLFRVAYVYRVRATLSATYIKNKLGEGWKSTPIFEPERAFVKEEGITEYV